MGRLVSRARRAAQPRSPSVTPTARAALPSPSVPARPSRSPHPPKPPPPPPCRPRTGPELHRQQSTVVVRTLHTRPVAAFFALSQSYCLYCYCNFFFLSRSIAVCVRACSKCSARKRNDPLECSGQPRCLERRWRANDRSISIFLRPKIFLFKWKLLVKYPHVVRTIILVPTVIIYRIIIYRYDRLFSHPLKWYKWPRRRWSLNRKSDSP